MREIGPAFVVLGEPIFVYDGTVDLGCPLYDKGHIWVGRAPLGRGRSPLPWFLSKLRDAVD